MKETTAKRLAKTERAIKAASDLLNAGDTEFAVGRAYYAMFYTAEALLNEKGFRFRKHGAVHGAFARHFIKTGELEAKYHRWLIDAFDQRIAGDYWLEAPTVAEEVLEAIRQARDFLAAARRYLEEPSGSSSR